MLLAMRNARRGSCASVRQHQSIYGVASDPEVAGSRSMPPRLAVSEQPLLSSRERIVILRYYFVLSGVFPVLCSGRISPGNPETRLSGFLCFREDALSQFCVGKATGVRRVEGVGLHSDQRGAPDVPSSHPRSKPTIIAISALLELVEWLELRRKSRQGGCPCNAAPTPLSPPVSTRSESSASGSGGPPLVQSARAESPGRIPNPAPTPAPKTSRRQRAGGRS